LNVIEVLYYDNLMALLTRNDIQRWLKFFLVGIIETANKAIEGLREIIKLKQDCETKRILTLGKRAPKWQILLQYLFTQPVVRPDDVAKVTETSLVTAYKLIDDFEQLNILQAIGDAQRNKVYIFNEYFKVFK